MNNKYFTLTLTHSEMLCAATALGFATLPLPIQANKILTGVAFQEEIHRGYELLQKRGLLQTLSRSKWQLDNLVVILTHWLATPDATLRLDVWKIDGIQRQAILFFWQMQTLWVQPEADAYQITFFEALEDWREYSANWIGCLAESGETLEMLLPPVNLMTFLPQLQRNLVDMEPILRRAEVLPEIAQQVTTKLRSVNQVITLIWRSERGEQEKMQQVLLLSTPTETWGGSVEMREQLVTLRPFSKSDLMCLFYSYTTFLV